jgi:hypothetical protein
MQKSLMFSIKQFFPGAAQWSANFPQRFPNTNARLREIARRGYEDADTTDRKRQAEAVSLFLSALRITATAVAPQQAGAQPRRPAG